MNKNELQQYIGNFNRDDCTIEFVLGHKRQATYTFKNVQIADNLQSEVLNMLVDNTNNIINISEIKTFTSLAKEDNILEYLNVTEVDGYRKLIADFENNDNMVTNLNDLGDINFHFTHLADNDRHNIKIFRRYSKSKSLAKGIICRFLGDTFDKINTKIIQIEDTIDFIVIDNEHIFIMSRYSFETITNYKDKYMESLTAALIQIEEADIINNFDRFKEDCSSSIRIAKQFNEAMKNDSIALIRENPEAVVNAICEAELAIDFNNNKFEYESREQLGILVLLLSDRYAKTLIGNHIVN